MCRLLRLLRRQRPMRFSGWTDLTERKGEGSMEIEMKDELANTVERLAAEAQIAELKAAAVSVPSAVANGRKTLPVAMVNLLAKQGVTVDSMEAGAVDAALVSLSVEQRIAVKAQLMRAGLLG